MKTNILISQTLKAATPIYNKVQLPHQLSGPFEKFYIWTCKEKGQRHGCRHQFADYAIPGRPAKMRVRFSQCIKVTSFCTDCPEIRWSFIFSLKSEKRANPPWLQKAEAFERYRKICPDKFSCLCLAQIQISSKTWFSVFLGNITALFINLGLVW